MTDLNEGDGGAVVGELENGGRRLDAGPSNRRIVRLLEGPNEGVDGRVSNAGRLNPGSVQDEDGHCAEKVDVVKIVQLTLDEKRSKLISNIDYVGLRCHDDVLNLHGSSY